MANNLDKNQYGQAIKLQTIFLILIFLYYYWSLLPWLYCHLKYHCNTGKIWFFYTIDCALHEYKWCHQMEGRSIGQNLTDHIKILPGFKINTSILSNMVIKNCPFSFYKLSLRTRKQLLTLQSILLWQFYCLLSGMWWKGYIFSAWNGLRYENTKLWIALHQKENLTSKVF